MREVKMPSGAILKVNPAPFSEAKALYKSVLKSLKGIGVAPGTDLATLFRDFYCSVFSDDEVEVNLHKCMLRCQYKELKVEPSLFESENARADYMEVCMEVGKENLAPFTKNLSALYSTLSGMINPAPESKL